MHQILRNILYIEDGNVKAHFLKHKIRIRRIGRLLAWLKIVPKMKMASEISIILENLKGNQVNSTDNDKVIKSVSGKSKFTLVAIALGVILLIFSASSPDDSTTSTNSSVATVATNVYVQTVQTANLADSGYTYQEVFDSFFTNPHWEYFKSKEGYNIVEFTGESIYKENDVKIKVQYIITNETETTLEWELGYYDIDGVPQDLLTFDGMIYAAIESYEVKKN